MKIFKISSKWWKMEPTITLYHGTTEENLKGILRDGFMPFKTGNKLDEVLGKYGYDRNTVPSWVWKYEMDFRKDTPYIYFSTSKTQAGLYADKSAGEFEHCILKVLNRWLHEEKRDLIKIPEYKPVVITVDAPWERFKSHKTQEEYKFLLENKNMKRYDWADVAFEFWIDVPLSKEYIVKWEYYQSNTRKL